MSIDTNTLPLDASTMESILGRLKAVNSLWTGQEFGATYLDFPDNFPVRSSNGELLGHFVWDEAEQWLFNPITHEASEADRVKNIP
jgi:hypothetical protein